MRSVLEPQNPQNTGESSRFWWISLGSFGDFFEFSAEIQEKNLKMDSMEAPEGYLSHFFFYIHK